LRQQGRTHKTSLLSQGPEIRLFRYRLPLSGGTLAQCLRDISRHTFERVGDDKIIVLNEPLRIKYRILQNEIVQHSIYEEMIGASSVLQNVLTAVQKVAPTDSTVLITGETGTGKELVANAIHRRSPRSARDMIKVNCAALPSELVASELFGHEKGAFTEHCNSASDVSRPRTAERFSWMKLEN
jgi:transcriptional regulator with AAA-type ATPase domain